MTGALSKQEITGMAYVPGTARGVLTHTPRPGAIWLARQSELRTFSASPAGAVVVDGAPFSHVMINLLSHGIPTVLVSAAQAATLTEGAAVVLDGARGRVLAAATPTEALTPIPPIPLHGRAVHTADNVAVQLCASVRSADGARRARSLGAAAIGLVRSEFLVPESGDPPDANYFARAFAALCEAAHPLAINIRLIDIAADKCPAWLGESAKLIGPIGFQGARLYASEPVAGVYRAQLAAIARLPTHYRVRLIVPYIVSIDELRQLRAEIAARLPEALLVGAMAETPAAALEIAEFCEVADFVALGTNDLMQCLFAADRDEPALAHYLDPHAPVLYRFLRTVAQNAGAQLLRVQVCGVLAQLAGGLPLLLGLGYRVFSVDPVVIPWLAATVARLDTTRAAALADAACAARTSDEVRSLLAENAVIGL